MADCVVQYPHTRCQRRLATLIMLAVVAVTMAASNAFLLTPDGSPLRVGAALLFILLPGLVWSELLLPYCEPLLRWTIGSGIGFAAAILTGLLLHALPGPILLWQWVAAVDLLVIVPLVGLLFTPHASPEKLQTGFDRRLLLLLAIVLLGGFFRFAGLDYSEYQGDEIEAVAPAARAIEGYEDALTLQRRKAPAEVLLPMTMWLATGVLTEGMARLPFAVAGMLLIPCLFVMGRRLFSTEAGLAAALVAALCGLLVGFSRVVQYQSIVILMMALSLLCAWEWRARGSPLWAALAGSFLGIGLLAHYDAIVVAPALAYIAAVAVIRPSGAQKRPPQAMLIGSLVATGACLLVAAPFYVAYLFNPRVGATESYLAGRIGGQFLHDNLANFLHVTSFYSSFYFVVIIGLLAWSGITWSLCVGQGTARAGRQSRHTCVSLAIISLLAWSGIWKFIGFQWAAAFLLVLLVGALFSRRASVEQISVILWAGYAFSAFVFVVQSPGTHVYVVMAPLALLAGIGAAALWGELEGRRATSLAVASTVAAILVFGGYLTAAYLRQDVKYWQDWPQSRLSLYWMPEEYADPNGIAIFGMVHRSGWKAAGAWLQERQVSSYDSNEKPQVTVWYMRNAPRPSKDEQTYCAKLPQTIFIADDLVGAAGHYAVTPDTLAGYQRIGSISQANGTGIAIYLLQSASVGSTGKPDSTQLNADFDHTAVPGMFVHPPAPQHKVNANFDNQVRLLGYDLDCITPDGHVALTLYWQALSTLSADYHVFIHLEGGLTPGSPAGIWGQSDGVPGNASPPLLLWDTAQLLAGQQSGAEPLPTSTWRTGQVIRDRRSFQISAETPPGSYTLIAGLYQPQTGGRLKLLDADNMPSSDYAKLTDIAVPVAAELAVGKAP